MAIIKQRNTTMIYKYLMCLIGIMLALPLLVLTALAFTLPITFSGIGYLTAGLLVISGLVLAPWMRRHPYWLTLAGGIMAFVIAGVRVFSGEQNTDSNLKMMTLPGGTETRWISYLIDEQDSLIFGEALFHAIGGDSQTEHQGITERLYAAYSEMKIAQGITPSPFVDTYLYFQQPTAFDAIVIDPKSDRHADTGIIFLHGFMGNVTAQCWEIAQAVSEYGAMTVCPSTGWEGKWWQPEGEQILRSTFKYLREQGIQKIYMGGFSNGGFGISRLVSKLGNEPGLNGLFFIDGVYDGASIRETGLPVLIIQGLQDERMPAAEARRIAAVIGVSGKYVELNSDHFLIIKQPGLVQESLTTWLENQVSGPSATGHACQPSPILRSGNSFPEIQGTMKSDGELWALLFFDSAASNQDLKFAWRITVSGPSGEDFHAQAQNENGKTILPIWGPEYHGGSSWQRPGIEWGTGFNFPEPGCWTITVTSGATIGEIYLDVLAP